jgi:hypothetical protein
MFPLGLVAVIDRQTANAGGWGVLIGCYAVYLVHGFFYFRSKTTVRTVILHRSRGLAPRQHRWMPRHDANALN